MPMVLADWQTTLDSINAEITTMVGSVNGHFGDMTQDQWASYKQLTEQKQLAENMIARLGGASQEHANVIVTNSDTSY